MYYQNYEDYMRQVLGYPNMSTNDNCNDGYYQVSMSMRPAYEMPEEREDLYPEIYRLIYPMVCKACDEVGDREITEELVENLTNTIYINFEGEATVEVPMQRAENRNGDVKNPNAKEEVRQTRQSNPFLRDLIRILILRRLFERRRPRPRPRPHFPPRPPMPGPRPPFPGVGGMMRPPMPRGYEDLYY